MRVGGRRGCVRGEDGGHVRGQSWAWEAQASHLLGVHSRWTGFGHFRLSDACCPSRWLQSTARECGHAAVIQHSAKVFFFFFSKSKSRS